MNAAVAYLEQNLDQETAIDRWVEDLHNPELYFTIPVRVRDGGQSPLGPSAVRPMFQILPDSETPSMADYLDAPASRVHWLTGCPCQDLARNRPCNKEHQS